MESRNILETLPVIHEVAQQNRLEYAVVGGTVTDALLDQSTIIDTSRRSVFIHDDYEIPLLRDNGTYKDIDLLGFTSDKMTIRGTLENISDEVHHVYPHTSVSLSGYEANLSGPDIQLVSRTVRTDENLYLALGDIVHELPGAILEDTWTAQYRDRSFSILHPASHLGSYLVRSITGVRQKDKQKVAYLDARVATAFDESELRDFAVWREFADDVAWRYSLTELMRRRDMGTLKMVLGRVGLRGVELSPTLVRLAQSPDSLMAKIAHKAISMSRPAQVTVLK